MNQMLDTLDKMKELPVVRFFAQFITGQTQSPFFANLKTRLAMGQAGSLARELFVWAILLALGVFLIDQAFYWTAPSNRERALENWQGFVSGCRRAGEGARRLIDRLGSAGRQERGR